MGGTDDPRFASAIPGRRSGPAAGLQRLPAALSERPEQYLGGGGRAALPRADAQPPARPRRRGACAGAGAAAARRIGYGSPSSTRTPTTTQIALSTASISPDPSRRPTLRLSAG